MKLSDSFIQQALPNSEYQLVDSSHEYHVAIDSRTVTPGALFIALKGATTNGHEFVAQAINNGAHGLIIEKQQEQCLASLPESCLKNLTVIKVSNTQQALFDMARWWRLQFEYPVIGITGSMGKTTTKEMLKNILKKASIKAYVSQGNQNSITGLPMNILNMKKEHSLAVFELGAHKIGDIGLFADILQPTTGVITGIGHSHTTFLGSLKEIAYQKRQLFKNFKADSIGVIAGDEPLLHTAYYHHPVIRFGLKTRNQVQARKIKTYKAPSGQYVTSLVLRIYQQEFPLILSSNHKGRMYNALAAAAMAHHLGISPEAIIAGIEEFAGFDGRFTQKEMKNGWGILIDDCYNSNPESLRAALLAFQAMGSSGKKIAVIGEMREQGEKEAFWHRQIGRMLAKTPSLDAVLFVGNLTKEAVKTAPFSLKKIWVKDWQDAQGVLHEILDRELNLVLVKASRGVCLDNLVREFVVQT